MKAHPSAAEVQHWANWVLGTLADNSGHFDLLIGFNSKKSLSL
jgi:hypothetical protein